MTDRRQVVIVCNDLVLSFMSPGICFEDSYFYLINLQLCMASSITKD